MMRYTFKGTKTIRGKKYTLRTWMKHWLDFTGHGYILQWLEIVKTKG